MLETRNDSIEGKRVLISGSGNVAQYAAEKPSNWVQKYDRFRLNGFVLFLTAGMAEAQLAALIG